VMAWGNLTGLRADGHLLKLSTSMCVAQPELAAVSCTGRELPALGACRPAGHFLHAAIATGAHISGMETSRPQ
jgi:hypothetical protein